MYTSSSELKAELDRYTPGSGAFFVLFFCLSIYLHHLICCLIRGTDANLLFFLLYSTCILTVCSQLTEEKWSFYHSSRAHVHRPSCVATEVERLNALMQKKIGQSILGKVRKQHQQISDLIISHFHQRMQIILFLTIKKDHILQQSLHFNYTKYMQFTNICSALFSS